jgi:hypothetical protein
VTRVYLPSTGNPIVDGIFVDEVQMRSPHVDYTGWQADHAHYSAIKDQVKGKTPAGFLVVNPGTSQHASAFSCIRSAIHIRA